MILHQMQISCNCYKMRLAAHQLGLPLRLKEYPLFASDMRKLTFLAKNPSGRVPLLALEFAWSLPKRNRPLYRRRSRPRESE